MKTRNEVKQVVLSILSEMTEDALLPIIDEHTNAVKTLGFDTDDGNDLATLIGMRLGCEVPDNVNPLYNEAKSKGAEGYERTVGEIIDLVCELAEKEASHA